MGQTPAARLAAYVRGGGVVVPVLTALLAFVIGGLVVLITGHDPIATYKAIFEGTGFQWLFPWVTGSDRATAALNLQQTLILTTPLILTGLAVAFAFRAGLFNIGGQGQYTVGGDRGRLGRLLVRRDARLPPHRAGGRGRLPGRGGVGRDRGVAQGDGWGQRGDLHDHAQLHGPLDRVLPVLAGRPAPEQPRRVAAGLERHRRRRPPAGVVGRPGAPGPAHRHLHRARGGGGLLGAAEPLDDRLRGAGGRAQPRGRSLRRHQRRQELRAGDGGLRRVRRPGRVDGRARAGSTGSPRTTSRSRRSASSASPSPCWAATRPSAPWRPGCCSAVCSAAPRSATSTRRSSSPSWPPT